MEGYNLRALDDQYQAQYLTHHRSVLLFLFKREPSRNQDRWWAQALNHLYHTSLAILDGKFCAHSIPLNPVHYLRLPFLVVQPDCQLPNCGDNTGEFKEDSGLFPI